MGPSYGACRGCGFRKFILGGWCMQCAPLMPGADKIVMQPPDSQPDIVAETSTLSVTIYETATTVPAWVVFMHQLSRRGQASRYAPSKRLNQIDLTDIHRDKWPELSDVERVTLVYKEKQTV